MIEIIGIYSRTRQARETSLSSLSGQTNNTTLSSNTLRTRQTSTTLQDKKTKGRSLEIKVQATHS